MKELAVIGVGVGGEVGVWTEEFCGRRRGGISITRDGCEWSQRL